MGSFISFSVQGGCRNRYTGEEPGMVELQSGISGIRRKGGSPFV